MSAPAGLVWLVPLPPLLAAAALLFGGRWPRAAIAWLATGAVGASLVVALAVLVGVAAGGQAAPGLGWGSVGGRSVSLQVMADRLSGVAAVLVAAVALVVFVYAAASMRGKPGYARFFGQLSLFVGGMLTLVVAGSLLLLYAAWELVGLASFLLIGFYRERPAAGRAAVKAFLVTRIGDLGLLVGILLLFPALGDFSIAHANEAAGQLDQGFLTLVALLLFLGAAGKSAQVPLHVWLPDAMEGPTPVSALIHSATMVAAGVFLVARLHPLFLAAGPAPVVVATVGALTALLGAAAAAAQRDLKRVLAYSTMSQLGEMMAALGAGALGAGLFHLVSQALFKACLFLAAGSVGHAFGDDTDMARMGGLRRAMPRTFLAFVLGALALVAVPPFAGFWSGEAVLGALWRAYPPLFAVVLVAVGVAGFYTTRAGLLTFFGHRRSGEEAHESPAGLWGPALVLGALAAVGGAVDAPLVGHPLSRFLSARPEPADLLVTVLELAATLAGAGAAVAFYASRSRDPAWRPGRHGGVAGWALAGFGVDRLYGATVVRGARAASAVLSVFDARVVDPVPRGVVALALAVSGRARAFDTGVVDRAANGMADAALALVRGAGSWDARRLDRAVGDFALAWRAASGRLARTQTGRVYHYLLAVALWGAGALALVLLAWRTG